MKWTNEDVALVEKFIDIKNKGYYCDGTQLTEVYNRVLEKHVNPTNCGSCIRQRINELEGALQQFKKSIELNSKPSESVSEEGVDNTKEDTKKPARKAKK
jgi:hypothetical protein